MRKYEIITIFQNSGELESHKKAVKELLTRHNAELLTEEDWGIRTLHYEKNKLPQGFVHYQTINLEPDNVKEISREMGITGGVLQHMIKRAS